MKIKSDHFETMEELLDTIKMWVREEEIDYARWFGLNEMYILANEIERLKAREQQCIDHYLVQCKYASEMESKAITLHNIIKEVREYLEKASYLQGNKVLEEKDILEILDKVSDE